MKSINRTVAHAVRLEYDNNTGTVYLVFEITDERFKQRVKKEWENDIPLKLIGKDLEEVYDADI